MKQVRKSVFETNSSSVHSLTFCTVEEYEKFMKGDLALSIYDEELIPVEDVKYDDSFTHQQIEVLENKSNFTGCCIEYEHELVKLSDGTTFGKIKFDKYD